MLAISPQTKIWLMVKPIDFRKGIDTLAQVCRQQLEQNPFSGSWFFFCNQRKTACKILAYDGQGFWLCMKRFSEKKFSWWPSSAEKIVRLSPQELQTLLWNGNPVQAQFAPLWKPV